MERAQAFEDLLVLLVVVALGARFINGGDNVVWPATAIFTRSRSFWPIMATILMVTAVVAAVVAVVPVVGVIVAAASWAMSARILVETHFSFFGVGVLVSCLYQFVDGCGPLAVQLATKLLMSEPFGEGSYGLDIGDVGDRVSCL